MGSSLSSKEHSTYPEMVVTELKSTLGAAAGVMGEDGWLIIFN